MSAMYKRFVFWGVLLALTLAVGGYQAQAAEWSGSVGTVTSKDIVIVMEFIDSDPPKGAQVQVYESPRGKPNRLICLGVVKGVSGRAVVAVMQPCSAPIRPGLRVIITTKPISPEN